MLFISDQLIPPAFDHSPHYQTELAPLLRLQLLWNLFVRDRIFLRQPMRLIVPSYLGIKKSPHIQKEPYSAPPDNLEGHKRADYVDHRMWTIRPSPHQSIWIGTKDSLVTKTTGRDGFLLAPAPSGLSLFPALPLYLSLAPAQASQSRAFTTHQKS